MEDLYREVILDHYKNPRGHGVIEDADASAEGMNPLCGDEVAIYVAFDEDGETIDEVKFSGRGCAISQASTSMLMEMVKGRTAAEVGELSKDELLEEIGIPNMSPIRIKSAILSRSAVFSWRPFRYVPFVDPMSSTYMKSSRRKTRACADEATPGLRIPAWRRALSVARTPWAFVLFEVVSWAGGGWAAGGA